MQKLIKHFSFCSLAAILLAGCKRLDSIDYSPKLTSEIFLQNQHWVKIQLASFNFVWSQPTSTLIVYFVGVFAMFAGYRFLSVTQNQQAKRWWGIGLLLTGLGALFAGTSYQAFGYEIKCNGRAFCTYTSWWEVIYMLLSVPGMNAFLVASAYTNTKDNFRKAIVAYALINTIVYSALLLYGAFSPIRFLVSFECLVLVSAPSVFFLLFLHGLAYAKNKDLLNLSLLNGWLIFIAVGVAYGVYLSSGLTQRLWQNRIWFTENDVLHVGMICWVYYLLKNLPDKVMDLK